MKYLLKQKSSFLLYCTVLILANLPLYAQLTQRVITITRPNMDIPGLAKAIAVQTGVEYSLNMQNTSLKKNVHLKPGRWKLEDVMKEVQQQVGLEYKILGDHILFTDYKPVKKVDSVQVVKRKAIAATKPTTTTYIPSRKALPVVTKTAPDPTYLTPIRSDYAAPAPLTFVQPRHMIINERQITNTKETPPEKERRHINLPHLWAPPLAEAGLTANDMVYLSASVQAGIQYFYGIATFGITSGGMRFRYGAGIRIPLDEKNALHAAFTTGTLSRKPIDTIKYDGLLIERMNSYGLSWSGKIRPRLNLQVEVNYNTLKKSSDSAVLTMAKERNYYRYGTPLYKMGAGEKPTWIGARISLFYNLRRE